MATKYSEAEIAAVIVQQLRTDGWAVHEEVTLGNGQSRADIVAVMDVGACLPVVRIIECKTTLSADLVAQALDWQRHGYAHFIEVAVPYNQHGRARTRGADYLRHALIRAGIGLMTVQAEADWRADEEGKARRLYVVNSVEPKLNRPRGPLAHPDRWRHWLRDFRAGQDRLRRHAAHDQHVAAGSRLSRGAGGFWTPYQETMRIIRDHLRANGESSISEILDVVGKGHYSKASVARSTIPGALRAYEQAWCVAVRRGKALTYRLRTEEDGDAPEVHAEPLPRTARSPEPPRTEDVADIFGGDVS